MNFNYFISETVFSYLLEAVDLVATHGWKLLPLYRFCPESGLWRHRDFRPEAVMRLSDISYRAGKLEHRSRHATEPEWALETYLEEARSIIARIEEEAVQAQVDDPSLGADFEHLRWFWMPAEIQAELKGDTLPTRWTPIHLRT